MVKGMLAETTGLVLDRQFLGEIMADYLDGLFYLWPSANSGNIPWLLMRTIRTYSLVGRIVRPGSIIAKALHKHAREVVLGDYNRVRIRRGYRARIDVSFRNHEVDSRKQDMPIETIQLVVTCERPSGPENILDTALELPTHTFLRRVAEFGDPTPEALSLVSTAREILQTHIRQRTDLVYDNDDT